ncbi:hypothetical protein N7462_003283 [Penicillium macrosclerotiorum]|uniref:uncharacterized protein n=1 Tax=Penicillium macrosclerotiorum TaxID=303699 RepID=UPI00254878EE|nr:uncharacterized protein N7462_003283 [Penicillium macrosclerotiorum]KAJ5688891.1 hypothetical protein N7462_003283 [Penicillium macrosclerotiorum]
MEVLQTPPETSTYVTIAEHQSRTPASFVNGPPVLHYHSQRCKVVILERDLVANPALNALRGERASTNGNAAAAPQDTEDEESVEIAIEGVDTWVTSEKLLLFSPSASTGVSIPYPSISLHAIQRLRVPGGDATEVQGLYMQIAIPTAPSEDDEEECITITVVPPSEDEAAGGNTETSAAVEGTAEERALQDLSDEPQEAPAQLLYNAMSACSNLHPDPVEPGDEDDEEDAKFMSVEDHGYALYQLGQEAIGSTNGDLPPPVEGSSGWITADNMHEYFDEEGNWIAEGEPPSFPALGPGAGTVRAREENDAEEEQEGEDEMTKWQRTD